MKKQYINRVEAFYLLDKISVMNVLNLKKKLTII